VTITVAITVATKPLIFHPERRKYRNKSKSFTPPLPSPLPPSQAAEKQGINRSDT